MHKRIRHTIEMLLAWLAYGLFRVMPMDMASSVGGKLGRLIGPRLKAHKTALGNLSRIMPEYSVEQREKIVAEMWDNLGRTIAEMPHMAGLTGKRFAAHVVFEGKEILEEAAVGGKGAIVFSGHFGNWEVMPRTAAEHGFPLALVYRHANNPGAEKLVRHARRNSHAGLFKKGREDVRDMLAHLKGKGLLGMLVDQKMNDGIAVPFFGQPAMTAPAMAELALKMDVPLIPARVVRTGGTHFCVAVYPPLETEGRTAEAIMAEVNQLFEYWIRRHPAQWFWVHNRWPG